MKWQYRCDSFQGAWSDSVHRFASFNNPVCHKVHLPYELNHYREFLRGQHHYDSYLLSGVSGYGAQVYDGVVQRHQDFLQGIVRVDLFGLREEGQIDGPLIAPLRPDVPVLHPGRTYLLETVIRTLEMGHHFTQGTTDSNEIWLEVTVTSGSRVIGRSGTLDPQRGNEVDPWAHFVNVFMLGEGNRIDRRNAQDIFTPLYNHEIPPGAAQTVHYALELPEDLDAPVTVSVRLQYRKFDQRFMDFVARVNAELGNPIRGYQPGQPYTNDLPITTLAEDRITFAVAGSDEQLEQQAPDIPVWQRWNDYGIGLHQRYKPDDNARDRAVRLAREKYPAANHALSDVVIYRLTPPRTEDPTSLPDPQSADVRSAEEP